MSLKTKLKDWWRDQWTPIGEEPVEPEIEHIGFNDVPIVEQIHEDTGITVNPKGRIRKTSVKKYEPEEHRHGGRVVRVMPRDLRHMKELSEKTDD